jgi:class 3 adenylate cyclase
LLTVEEPVTPGATVPDVAARNAYIAEVLGDAVARHAGTLVPARAEGVPHAGVFAEAPAALAAATAAQRALLAARPGDSEPLWVRMAIHTGIVAPGNVEYRSGPAFSRVTCLLAAAQGGQILVSAVAAELASNAVPPGAELHDLGEHRLGELARPERVVQFVAAGLPTISAPLRTA